MRRLSPLLRRYHFDFVPLQSAGIKEKLNLDDAELLSQMRLLTAEDELYDGADAIVRVASGIWWALPLYWLSQLPFVLRGLRKLYGLIAKNRNCGDARCRVSGAGRRLDRFNLFLAALPPLLALVAGTRWPAWVWMWVLALSFFFSAKWITLLPLLSSRREISRLRCLAYVFLWPGMDARAFCGNRLVPAPTFCEWRKATVITLFGAGVLWLGIPVLGVKHLLAGGWLGMWAIVLMLHFGLFHLLSLIWRARGVDAKPIMRSPAAASSLGSFWGQRWNTGFSDLISLSVYRPLARRWGAKTAMWVTFLFSGLLHELVISVPARGGYGLPTAYFLLQALGLHLERTQFARRLGLASGWKGWCLVVMITVLPAYGLFAPIFIRHVILPMLHAIGAIV